MECPICLEKFTDGGDHEPRMVIPSYQTVCISCLRTLQDPICPLSRQAITVPVEDLPRNFALIEAIQERSQELSEATSTAETPSFPSVSSLSLDALDSAALEAELRRRRAEEHNQRCWSEINTRESRSNQILARVAGISEEAQAMNDEITVLRERLSDLESNSSRLDLESQRLQKENAQIQIELKELRSELAPEGEFLPALPSASIATDVGGRASSATSATPPTPPAGEPEPVDEITRHVALLQYGSTKGKTKAARALWSLAKNADNKVRIAREGGFEPLIALLRDGSAEGKTNAAVTLGNLATNDDNKANILLEEGVIKITHEEETDVAAKGAIQQLLDKIRK